MCSAFHRSLTLPALCASLLLSFAPAIAQEKGDTDKKPTQAEVASKTERLKTIAKSDPAYVKALDAADLKGALKLVDKPAAFKGTVVKVFAPKSGNLVILNFAKDYKTALTAVLMKDDFKDFPDLNSLLDKEVLVSGKISVFKELPQILLSKPEQLKLVK